MTPRCVKCKQKSSFVVTFETSNDYFFVQFRFDRHTMNLKHHCIVPGCVPANPASILGKHSIPRKSDPVRRSAWLQFCGIEADTLGRTHFMCSKHFADDAYQPAGRALGRDRREWRLMFDSVPTLFPPTANDPLSASENEPSETMPLPGNTQIVEIYMPIEDLMSVALRP